MPRECRHINELINTTFREDRFGARSRNFLGAAAYCRSDFPYRHFAAPTGVPHGFLRAILGSEEWRIPSICALIQIKHPTGRRRVHCGRRQRPPVRLWKSDAMGVRAIDRGVKGCIYLNGTQRAENERATVSRDLTEMPGVDVRASAPTHLKSYQIHAVNSAPAPRIFPHRASSARTTISSRSRVLRALRGGRGIQAQFRGPIWQR